MGVGLRIGYGELRICGKGVLFISQLCMSLTCAAISASPCTVAYVDGSAGGFSPTHLEQHLRARVGVAQGEEGLLGYLLEKVRVYRVFSVFSLLSLLHLLQYHISNEVS